MTLIEYARQLRPYIEKAAQNLDDTDALKAVTLFPSWAPGTEYTAGTKVKHGGVLYSILQDHTSQDTWAPDTAPSLFAKVLIPIRLLSRNGNSRTAPTLIKRAIKYALRARCTKALLTAMCGARLLIRQAGISLNKEEQGVVFISTNY